MVVPLASDGGLKNAESSIVLFSRRHRVPLHGAVSAGGARAGHDQFTADFAGVPFLDAAARCRNFGDQPGAGPVEAATFPIAGPLPER